MYCMWYLRGKGCSGLTPIHWIPYRDVNPVPTNPLADDIATVLLGPVPLT